MRTHSIPVATGLAVALALGVGASGTVQAAPTTKTVATVKSQPSNDARGEASVVKSFDQTPVRASQGADYWTPQRMRNAIPVQPVVKAGKMTALSSVPSGAESTTDFTVPRWAGKLFFRSAGRDYVCSASTSRTQRRDVVVTAGHCVTYKGKWSTNLVYVPRYNNGKAPMGKWATNKIATYREWERQNQMARDMAFLQMRPLNGKKVQDVTGGQPIREGWSRTQNGARIIGWPAEDEFDGEKARQCTGPITPGEWNKTDATMLCDMNGGASGGPWHRPSRTVGGTKIPGGVFAVSSRGTTFDTKMLIAAPFPKGFQDLLKRF